MGAEASDRANRDVEVRHSTERSCLRTKLCDALARRRERLSIDRVDVAKPRAHVECASRRAAKEKQRMRLLQWADIGMRALNTIELTRKIERPVIRPGQLHQLKIFRRPSIALVLWAEIPVSMLLIIRFARDDVDGKPAASQMIERGDLARKHEYTVRTASQGSWPCKNASGR